MDRGIFIINNDYRIYSALNQVQEIRTGNTVRLEPRIMAVLVHLSERAGELVSREEMVHIIWNDYGGGDEALSQAISFLRKTLGDRNRTIIKTIPKKGYCLNAVLRMNELEQKQPIITDFLSIRRLVLKYMVLLYVLGTVGYFINNRLKLTSVGVEQNLSQVNRDVWPAVGKSPQFAKIGQASPKTVILKGIETDCNEKLPVLSVGRKPIHFASKETESYHFNDNTSKMITALDYEITTTLNFSTIVN